MSELKQRIHDEGNGLDYVLVGDVYLPDLKLEEPAETRPIGRWGRMHGDYLKENRPIMYNELVLTGRLASYLADLNEQAQERLECIIAQMKVAENITEDMKRRDQMEWVGAMNNIRNRAEEIILTELIYQ